MSNYYGMVRTNYFHVKDEEQFQALMAKVICGDGSLELWDNMKDANGNQLFGFGVYGSISGIPDENGEYDDMAYERLIDELGECVADDDAILIIEAGHEKLGYVGGGVLVITSTRIVMKANLREWRHIFALRTGPAAYPEIRA